MNKSLVEINIVIARIEQNGWVITHSWDIDYLGMRRNNFQLSHIREDGVKEIIPFFGKARVGVFDAHSPYAGDDISPYETWEYLDMMNEQIAKFNKL